MYIFINEGIRKPAKGGQLLNEGGSRASQLLSHPERVHNRSPANTPAP